jgi:hypothetical protein
MNDLHTVLLSAAIVEELELIWMCGWRVDLFLFHVVAEVNIRYFKMCTQSLPNTSQNNPYKLRIAETSSLYLPQLNDVLSDHNLTTDTFQTGAPLRLPNRGPWRRSWLSRKVSGSIADGETGIFYWHNPSGRNMSLWSTQLLTEMSTSNISWG